MKKMIAVLTTCTMLFTGEGSAFANSTELKEAVNEVVGTPYKWGGTTTSGFDCSGFILYIFEPYNVDLPRTSKSQAEAGKKVSKANLREGDLVFFDTSGNGISHAGIYIGDGKFAHSSSSNGVTVSKLSESYYEIRYVTARRVISEKTYSAMMDIKE